MHLHLIVRTLLLASLSAPSLAQSEAAESGGSTPLARSATAHPPVEEVHVRGAQPDRAPADAAPATEINAIELKSINLATIEDAIVYEPSLMVRRRYIGDANGALGIRGSNMFQTARTLVYADGLPLHYHLQTRWSGAPRWSLVAPGEVESVKLLYGPFSAAYSGNAMGGVVEIKTKTPDERSVKFRGMLFNQHYAALATDADYPGGSLSASYGDRRDGMTFFAFYSHLENQAQPMNQYFALPRSSDPNDETATAVTGGLPGTDNHGNTAIYYGDSGAEKSTTDLLKLKTGYSWDHFQLAGTLAYENRTGASGPGNNFLTDAEREYFWSGAARLDNHIFSVAGAHFGEQQQKRQSLLFGIGLTGPVSRSGWSFDFNASHFDVLDDVTARGNRHPADPGFDGSGRVSKYDDTGWTTLDLSTGTDALVQRDDMALTLGLHYSRYRLVLNIFDSSDYQSREKTALGSASGGATTTEALYLHYDWQLSSAWDMMLGGRYEQWQASNGFHDDQQHPDRIAQGFSPKFALGFQAAPAWLLRYSVARALRFPLVEELYQNENSATAIQHANVQLEPEDGVHHNLMLERALTRGFMRINLFHEQISDTIFNQMGIVDGVELSTFLAIDEVTTQGAEFILNQSEILTNLDMRFNVSYVDAVITRNSHNPTTENNRMPRLPKWQSNLLMTYRISDTLNISSGLRYASNSFGELTNADTAKRTFGAHDSYLLLNLKANWQINSLCDLALGVDNITNQLAYVHHPWPSRTLYLEAGYEF